MNALTHSCFVVIMDKTLQKLYHDPTHPGGLSGIINLQKAAKEATGTQPSIESVTTFLQGDDVYTLHARALKRFPRNRVLVGGINKQFQADLVDMSEYRADNDDVRFLLTCIDIFSKYAWVRCLKNKTGPTVSNAFKDILSQGRIPDKLQTDQGTEFYNKHFKQLMTEHGIIHFSTANETKASVVERFNRTLKTRMWRYLTSVNSRRYIDVINDLVSAYNNAHHRSIKTTPVSVNKDNERQVFQALYKSKSKKPLVFKFDVGEKVRISKHRGIFRKGYQQTFTDEFFTITQCIGRDPPVYKLTDLAGEIVKGTFYEPELQRVLVDKNKTFKIEKILDRRGSGQKSKVFVKWLGWPDKFNAWISAKNVVDLQPKKR